MHLAYVRGRVALICIPIICTVFHLCNLSSLLHTLLPLALPPVPSKHASHKSDASATSTFSTRNTGPSDIPVLPRFCEVVRDLKATRHATEEDKDLNANIDISRYATI